MPKLKNKVPKRCLHKASGRDYVQLPGTPKPIYLGAHDSPVALQKYDEIVSHWLANGRQAPVDKNAGITISDLAARFLVHAGTYYLKHGSPTDSLSNYQCIIKRLIKLFGSKPADLFGPSSFKIVRSSWVADGLGRTTINKYCIRLRKIFRWGVSEELVNPNVAHALSSIEPLLRGRTTAPDFESIGPAPAKSVEAVLAIATPTIQAIMQVQILTAMRPGEVCSMRPCDLDRSRPIWIYTPRSHKNEHYNQTRTIPIGPKAQAILTPILDRARRNRDKDTWPIFFPRARKGESYDRRTYSQMIFYYCDKLKNKGIRGTKGTKKTPGKVAVKADRSFEMFTPNQLRHTGLSAIREQFGIESAQMVADHSNAVTTNIYVKEVNRDKKEMMKLKVAEAMG